MGVICIKNNVSGKIYLDSFPNLKNKWLTIQSQLNMGMHPNSQLQWDWREMGPEAFTYEVLEEKDTSDITDVKWELKQMEKSWLKKLEPYGERGYNKPPKE